MADKRTPDVLHWQRKQNEKSEYRKNIADAAKGLYKRILLKRKIFKSSTIKDFVGKIQRRNITILKRYYTISFTLAHVAQLPCAHLNTHLFEKSNKTSNKTSNKIGGKIVVQFQPTGSKEKDAVLMTLIEFCLTNGYRLFEEYRFTTERRWRFDWLIEELNVAVEFEGIFSKKSRHTTKGGFIGDVEKYNKATELGYNVIRVTAADYKNLKTILKNIDGNKS